MKHKLFSILLVLITFLQGFSQTLNSNQLTACSYLGDINGDGADDIITVNSSRLTVSQADFNRTVILTHDFSTAIKRLIIGDFVSTGRERGKKQIAAILTDGTTQAFAISDDLRSLWWWFTQPSFIGDDELFTAANFDGDIAEELMVHNPTSGQIRFFKKQAGGGFTQMTNFDIGNLGGTGPAGTSLVNVQILVGAFFSDHPTRKDLLVVDHAAQQMRLYSSVFQNNKLTFWWAFTTNGNLFSTGSQVCIANIDGGPRDGILIRNNSNGAYSLFKPDFDNGNLVIETGAKIGQLPIKTGNCRVVAAKVRDASFRNEQGGRTRDDILVLQLSDNLITRTDARFDGTNFTYWWAYNNTLSCGSGQTDVYTGGSHTGIDIYAISLATLYPNANFGGNGAPMLAVGNKSLSEVGLTSLGSIKVAWGYKAIIYYTGRQLGKIVFKKMEVIGDRETLPGSIANVEIVAYTPLNGFVDMHTHPASQLGFGKELFYGGNDGNIAQALGECNCMHNYIQKVGPFEPGGYCNKQNFFRNKLVDKMDEKYGIPVHTKLGGYPDFANWPKNRSVLHQQMWWEWIKRAKNGGLRVMVALVVNSHILADAAETSGSYDDEQAIEDEIAAIKQLARNHPADFEIALTPADLRRIVRSGKLAIILGTETDNIGNFYAPANPKSANVRYNAVPTNDDVAREIDKLWDMGVRYMFPIHITDNAFGGSAIYETGFNAANKYNTGRVFNAEVVNTAETGIGFKLGSGHETFSQSSSVHDFGSGFEYLLAGMYDEVSNFFSTFGINTNILPNQIMPNVRGNYPAYADIGAGRGHRNALGLTATGQFAISYMMQKGMMIDIDHMSEKSATATLGMATQFNYPVNSGHNGLRGTDGNENARTIQQLTTIKNLGGLFGLGHGGEASHFLNYYREALRAMDYKQIAIGTDANGLYPLPDKPDDNARIDYDNGSITKCQTGTKVWNYNEEGMAHYGLFPDFIESLTAAGMTAGEKRIFLSSAEYFAQMWEKCERQKASVRN